MLDGALTMADLPNVTWRSPMEVFEIKLRSEIARMIEPVTMNRMHKNLARIAREAKTEVAMEFSRDPNSARSNMPRMERPDWLKAS